MEAVGQVVILVVVVGILFGALTIVIYAHRNLNRIVQSGVRLWLVRFGLILVGCVVGATLASVAWSWSDTQVIMGIPIPVAAWELIDGRWLDFVSPVSFLLWILNLIIWMGVVHLPVAMAVYWKNRKGELS